MARSNTALRDWLLQASPDQARQLAKAAETSVANLRHIAHGRRRASAGLAQRLTHVSHRLFPTRLWLYQKELCEACGKCPLAQ